MASLGLSPARRERIRAQIRRCVRDVVGGSGHLSSVALEELEILRGEVLGGGVTRYHFAGQAEIVSEFTGPVEADGSAPATHRQRAEGWIELDEALDLVRDEQGRVRLHPWRCRDPDRQETSQDGLAEMLASVLPPLEDG